MESKRRFYAIYDKSVELPRGDKQAISMSEYKKREAKMLSEGIIDKPLDTET